MNDRRNSRNALGMCCFVAALLFCPPMWADEEAATKSGFDVSAMELQEGFFDFRWDDAEGRIWLAIEEFDQPFLYVSSLATGLGSNPVGLDRGQLGDSRVVHFRRIGKRVFLVQENLKYRATTTNELEKRAIRDSFAESVLWSGELKTATDGSTLVDLTDFLLRDAHDCIGTLAATDQGSFSLAKNLSYVHMPRTKSFPKNSEFEVALTLTSKKPGRLARRVAADGKSITLRQHHSFVELPDGNYRPRKNDPRAGCFSVGYADYGVPIDESVEKEWITRHRLEKQNPAADVSPAKEPIVYYIDPGVPQPVRDALIEGASWWNEAFESAGFENAFQVRVLPEDADPMDVRYNVVQWVHRATRGWSYGQSVVDPRTGEIIKGHVLLGSLRVRQDHLLFEGLTSRSVAQGAHACPCGMSDMAHGMFLPQLDDRLSSVDVALARIRQLSAHEVGHTLGFAHNFAASTYGDRASVMDYPAPRTKIVDGEIDLSDAYGVGIGEWDKFTVQYAYSEFPAEDEDQELAELVANAIEAKMLYVTDADARPAGAAHPLGNLWDNGSEPVSALQHEMRVRRIAIDRFGESAIAMGEPLADLEKSFVPVYLHHRYQVEATAKMLGGYEYSYALRGDEQVPLQAIPVDQQVTALEVLAQTLQPAELVIPQSILDLIPPRIRNSASDRERFDSQTSPIFDPGSAIRAAAQLTIGNVLQPQRASRMASVGEDQLSLRAVIETLAGELQPQVPLETSASVPERNARRIVERAFVEQLISLSGAQSASADAKAIARQELKQLNSSFKEYAGAMPDTIEATAWRALTAEIERFLNRDYPEARPASAAELPPGSPIGS